MIDGCDHDGSRSKTVSARAARCVGAVGQFLFCACMPRRKVRIERSSTQ